MSSSAYNTFVSVSETMFPGISVTTGLRGRGTNTMETAAIKLGNQLMSNLPLQVLLYLNVIYFPCWLSVILMVVSVKYHLLNYLYKFVLVTILVAVIIIEIVRLYLGYLGNLTEKVPELAGFWLLTILLQLPLQGFLLFNTDLILVPIGKINHETTSFSPIKCQAVIIFFIFFYFKFFSSIRHRELWPSLYNSSLIMDIIS